MARVRNERGQFARMVTKYDVTVWDNTNGDVLRCEREITQAELDEIERWYEDEPWLAVVIDREWEEVEEG